VKLNVVIFHPKYLLTLWFDTYRKLYHCTPISSPYSRHLWTRLSYSPQNVSATRRNLRPWRPGRRERKRYFGTVRRRAPMRYTGYRRWTGRNEIVVRVQAGRLRNYHRWLVRGGTRSGRTSERDCKVVHTAVGSNLKDKIK